ncbi:MAG: DUF3429 domain-containing protein [Hyphomicrobiales bacterium]
MDDATTSLREQTPPAAYLLGFAGALPFVAAAAGCWLDPEQARQGLWLTAGIAYGAIILSFLGGIRWGAGFGWRSRGTEFAFSVLPALAAWVSLLLPAIVGVSILIAGFLLQALWDVIGVQNSQLPAWYGRLRLMLTALVVISLLAMLGKLLV